MSYSHIEDGQVLDFKFVKRQTDIVFYTGHIMQGQIFQMRRGDYSAVPAISNGLGPVHGFKTRLAAAEFILQSNKKMKEKSNGNT
jgi:hypothetical protein